MFYSNSKVHEDFQSYGMQIRASAFSLETLGSNPFPAIKWVIDDRLYLLLTEDPRGLTQSLLNSVDLYPTVVVFPILSR